MMPNFMTTPRWCAQLGVSGFETKCAKAGQDTSGMAMEGGFRAKEKLAQKVV
jgi:hypothetical protein